MPVEIIMNLLPQFSIRKENDIYLPCGSARSDVNHTLQIVTRIRLMTGTQLAKSLLHLDESHFFVIVYFFSFTCANISKQVPKTHNGLEIESHNTSKTRFKSAG